MFFFCCIFLCMDLSMYGLIHTDQDLIISTVFLATQKIIALIFKLSYFADVTLTVHTARLTAGV